MKIPSFARQVVETLRAGGRLELYSYDEYRLYEPRVKKTFKTLSRKQMTFLLDQELVQSGARGFVLS